jgi:hypothetical protein
MRALTDREQRLLRYGGVGIVIYLALFFGLQVWRVAERRKAEYRALVREAETWNNRLALYDDKAAVALKLMEQFRMDPATLAHTSLVARASAAIQQAALQGGVMLGAVRETPSRGVGREVTTIQLEGQGPAPALLKFLYGLGTLGFPVVTDTLQLTAPAMGAGPLKLNLTVQLLDFDSWKPADGRPDA